MKLLSVQIALIQVGNVEGQPYCHGMILVLMLNGVHICFLSSGSGRLY